MCTKLCLTLTTMCALTVYQGQLHWLTLVGIGTIWNYLFNQDMSALVKWLLRKGWKKAAMGGYTDVVIMIPILVLPVLELVR